MCMCVCLRVSHETTNVIEMFFIGGLILHFNSFGMVSVV